MSITQTNLAFIALPIVVLLVALFVGWITRRYLSTKGKHLCAADGTAVEFTGDPNAEIVIDPLSPMPGQSLLVQADRNRIGVKVAAIQAWAVPLAIGGTYGVLWATIPGVVEIQSVLGMLVAGALAQVYLICLFVHARHNHQEIIGQLEGKRITAQALAPFEAQGDVVCHEVNLGMLHVDHILVGAKGVFAIQTHPRAADVKKVTGPYPTVTYDGRRLFFPKEKDGDFLEHTIVAAEAVSAWMSDELKFQVAARAVISIPGWRVRRTSVEGIPVVNPQQFESLFAHISARPLTVDQIQTIVALIKAACTRTPGPAIDGHFPQEAEQLPD
jgi:hypothetical protein